MLCLCCQCSVSQWEWGEHDRKVPALWNPCSTKQLWRKSIEKKKKKSNTCSLDDHMNNVRMSCKTNTPALGPSGQMKQQSRNSCLQKWFWRNLVTKSKLLNSNTSVVNETRAVLSTSLIRAVYQIELSAVSISGPVHYECPASTILVRIL